MKEENEQREDFCSLCLVGPLAFAGAGAAAAGASVSKKHKAWKKALFISAVLSVVFIILSLAYYFLFNRDCKECKLKV